MPIRPYVAVVSRSDKLIARRRQLHPFCQQKDIVAYCLEHDIVVQAYSPLIRGRLDDPIFAQLAAKVCLNGHSCITRAHDRNLARTRTGADPPAVVASKRVSEVTPRLSATVGGPLT